MPPRKKKRCNKTQSQMGGLKLSDLKKLAKVGKDINKVLRKTKILSRGAMLASAVPRFRPVAAPAAAFLSQAGYGSGGTLRLAGGRRPRGRPKKKMMRY